VKIPGEQFPPRPDLKATWRAVEAIPVFVIAVFGGALLGLPATLLIGSCSASFIVVTMVGELAFLAAVLLWVKFVNKGPLGALGLPRQPLGDATAGIITGAALVLIGTVALALTRAAATSLLGHAPPSADQVASCVRGPSLVFLAPVVILVAPIGEETFFRGFLYKGLRNRLSAWPAAMVSGLIFAAVHFAGPGFLVLIPGLFVVGIGLALVYEKRQSLLASAAAHATFNLVGYLFIVFGRR
jgi:membrane protease YdiL (CAAX protease family)